MTERETSLKDSIVPRCFYQAGVLWSILKGEVGKGLRELAVCKSFKTVHFDQNPFFCYCLVMELKLLF